MPRPSEFPNVIAAVERHEKNLRQLEKTEWRLADLLLAGLGKPPKSPVACHYRIKQAIPDLNADTLKRLSQLWRIADAFPPKMRMRADLDTHITAGSPEVLRAVLTSPRRGKTLTQHIKLMKRAAASLRR
jgi:hypothetical protein